MDQESKIKYVICAFLVLISSVFFTPNIGVTKDKKPPSTKIKSHQNSEKTASKDEVSDQGDQEEEIDSTAEYIPPEIKPLPVMQGNALVIPIKGTIDLGLPPYIERSLNEHPEAELIIIEVDTLGGRVDAAIQIRDLLLSEGRPVVAYIYRRAISAGALISYAADHIVFSPGSTMGAATPIQLDKGQAKAVGEKMVSYFRSEMRATAEANGRDGDLAEAMVDADKVVPGVSVKGKLLTLTRDMAEKFGVASGFYDSPDDLYTALGFKKNQVARAEETWSENIARAVTDPTLSGLLMSIGMLGIMIELYTPGVGFAGILGFLSLLCFFLGHKVAGLAGSEELILILLGVMLLTAEVFIIPGFGIAGILGLALLAMGFITSMGELPDGMLWDYGYFEDPVKVFVYALVMTIIFMVIIAKYLPSTRLGSWLVLKEDLNSNKIERVDYEDGSALEHLVAVGDRGVTTTPLRLSGKARFECGVVDVISRDDYLESGQTVVVINVAGSRVVVIPIGFIENI